MRLEEELNQEEHAPKPTKSAPPHFMCVCTDARLLAFYGIFAAGFLTRPLGAATFGRIGDK